jgi:hypothetical protein
MLVILPSPISKLQHTPLPLQSATSQGACPNSLLFCCFQFRLTFGSTSGIVGVLSSFGHEQYLSNVVDPCIDPWCLIIEYFNKGIGFLVH